MQKETDISVVIPAYNEEQNLRLGALGKVTSFLAKKKYSYEVVIVDDGSTDASQRLIDEFIVEHPSFRLLKNHHQGKAATVITGMLAAQGKYIFFSDLDQATPIQEIDKFMPWFEKGYDLVIGSRNTRREGAPFFRALMGPGFMLLRTFILGLTDITDTQCGFKAFRKDVAQRIFHRLKLYGETRSVSGSQVTAGFDVEVLFLAKKMGFKIKEVPVEWHYIETRRVNPFVDSVRGFLDLLRIRWNGIRGKYD